MDIPDISLNGSFKGSITAIVASVVSSVISDTHQVLGVLSALVAIIAGIWTVLISIEKYRFIRARRKFDEDNCIKNCNLPSCASGCRIANILAQRSKDD